MPLSTSVSSSSTAPFGSTSLSASSLPMVQAPTAFKSGNAMAQFGASVTERPGAAASSLKVSWQRRSRSGLESSHVPTSALAASLGAGGGACADALSADAAIRPAPISDRIIMPAKLAHHAFFGGVSGTGVSGPLPENHEMMLLATSSSIA